MTAWTDLAGIVLSARERETNTMRSASLTCESQEKNTRPKGQEQPEPIDAETGSAGTSGCGRRGARGEPQLCRRSFRIGPALGPFDEKHIEPDDDRIMTAPKMCVSDPRTSECAASRVKGTSQVRPSPGRRGGERSRVVGVVPCAHEGSGRGAVGHSERGM